MIANTTQNPRLLSVRIGSLADDLLVPTGFSGYEAISTLSCFSLHLVSEKPDEVVPEKIPGQLASIALELADGTQRFFHGYVSRFSRGESGDRFTEYHAQVVPWLWFLTLTADCRIYQDLAVPDILKQVFQDNGFFDFRSALTGEHIRRDYCVQYRETDFHFVSRLMEEEGIWYYFEHTEDKHTLVFTDNVQSHAPCPGQSKVQLRPEGGSGVREDTINTWEVTRAVRSDRWTVRDYHFQMPDKTLECTRRSASNGNGNGKAEPRWEVFDYPGDYALRFNKPGQRLEQVMPEGEKVVRLRLEEEETPHVEVDGASQCRCFSPGFTFELLNPPQDTPKGPYLLTSVHHAATLGSELVSGAGTEGSYSNTFACLAPGTRFRPDRGTDKPVVAGPQTAVVVGPKDQEIDVDKHGRIKVQFHWDRYGKKNENSSCWLRVAQMWAGKRWGASFWPRIGQEVIVAFLEGDPDQPIVVGSVYNDIQRPPYLDDGPDPKHPHDPKLSGIKTCSTPGGKGFNEIRFDDTKGKEQLLLRAEQAMDVHVNGGQMISVGGDRHLTVGGGLRERIENYKDVHVIGPMRTLSAGDYRLKVNGEYVLMVEGRIDSYSKSTAVFAAHGLTVVGSTETVLLKCGGSFIKMTPSDIWIQADNVHINSGGDPDSIPKQPDIADPTDPVGADDAKSGFPSNK
jgi:type VI secretion system secreted protein VgrG